MNSLIIISLQNQLKIALIISFLMLIGSVLFVSCTTDNDTEYPKTKTTLFAENFSDNTDGEILNSNGWTNYAQSGTKKFTEQVYSGNGYAQFTSFQSGQSSNIAWLISPPFNMDMQQGETLVFQAAHAFLTAADNNLEVMVSTDYDGNIAHFNQASWLNLPAITPKPSNEFYEWVNSGEIDLSKFNGTLHVAFKVKGSGTNTNLDATFQIDNIRLYY
ncbi:MAG TPA: hypothetical protein DDZ41_12520 [Flavobacterium sp.]|nr:hypothetical protein [Flavobacterium sp.]